MTKDLPPTENLAYHAARILILIGFCGKPRSGRARLPAIQGRTLLAKLDFFMRYPSYLKMAADVLAKPLEPDDLGLENMDDIKTVESRMVRYLYGPWDSVYYVTIAYLVGKKLIDPPVSEKVDTFRINENGMQLLQDLRDDSAFSDFIKRADAIYHLFNNYTGSRLKDFIYTNFPEVVNRGIGELI